MNRQLWELGKCIPMSHSRLEESWGWKMHEWKKRWWNRGIMHKEPMQIENTKSDCVSDYDGRSSREDSYSMPYRSHDYVIKQNRIYRRGGFEKSLKYVLKSWVFVTILIKESFSMDWSCSMEYFSIELIEDSNSSPSHCLTDVGGMTGDWINSVSIACNSLSSKCHFWGTYKYTGASRS